MVDCPKCGTRLVKQSMLMRCPKCGYSPSTAIHVSPDIRDPNDVYDPKYIKTRNTTREEIKIENACNRH